MDNEQDIIEETRARSLRFMQVSFTLLALGAIAIGLGVHHYADALALADQQPEAIANSFLFMGAAYMLTLFVWDVILRPGK